MSTLLICSSSCVDNFTVNLLRRLIERLPLFGGETQPVSYTHLRYSILPYTDCHTADSPELASYPPHCLMGTEEPLLAPELSRLEAMARPKNSTNAYLADPEPFQAPQVTHEMCIRDRF